MEIIIIIAFGPFWSIGHLQELSRRPDPGPASQVVPKCNPTSLLQPSDGSARCFSGGLAFSFLVGSRPRLGLWYRSLGSGGCVKSYQWHKIGSVAATVLVVWRWGGGGGRGEGFSAKTALPMSVYRYRNNRFDQLHLSQWGTYSCLSRSVPEIHQHVAGTLSNQPATTVGLVQCLTAWVGWW